jgi:hypothetical protein
MTRREYLVINAVINMGLSVHIGIKYFISSVLQTNDNVRWFNLKQPIKYFALPTHTNRMAFCCLE